MALTGGAEFHHRTVVDLECILLLFCGSPCTTDDRKGLDCSGKVHETVDWEKGPKGHHMHSAWYTSLSSNRMLSQVKKPKRKIEDDIENVNPQDSIGPLPEASCTSPKTLRSSFGVLHDKTICVWCRKGNYKISDRDKGFLLLSTKDAWTNFKLHTVRLKENRTPVTATGVDNYPSGFCFGDHAQPLPRVGLYCRKKGRSNRN